MDENRFKDLFADADKAFNGKYQEELNLLTGLSRKEIDLITPDTQDLKIYSILIKIVEEASKENLSQAELINNIKKLGKIGIKIAKKVPQLASLL